MAKFPTDRIRQRRVECLPDWVVDHMIRLSEFAGHSGLPAFESALIDAMENVISELNRSTKAPLATLTPVLQTLNNVVFLKVNPALP